MTTWRTVLRAGPPGNDGGAVGAKFISTARLEEVVMHCLPAHYGEEIDYPTTRSPYSVILDEAENRLHAENALMVSLAGQGGLTRTNSMRGYFMCAFPTPTVGPL